MAAWLSLELQAQFGLRREEAMKFQPAYAIRLGGTGGFDPPEAGLGEGRQDPRHSRPPRRPDGGRMKSVMEIKWGLYGWRSS
jgi:hypothetical protein